MTLSFRLSTMARISFLLLVLWLLESLALVPVAMAYDQDTHFYGTYAMARFAGIRAEVALKMATSAQWMDEAYISDPLSMIVMPATGIKKRRLLHFPSDRRDGRVASTYQEGTYGNYENLDNSRIVLDLLRRLNLTPDLDDILLHTKTEADGDFANELLTEGLKEGNLMKSSAGLHTLEDSFAHAGTPAEEGHFNEWHWPDRPFASDADFKKYQRMTRTVMTGIVAIRERLPQEALDCAVNLPQSATPNCQRDMLTLGQQYSELPELAQTANYFALEDPRYVDAALTDYYNVATKVGLFKISRNEWAQMVEKAHQVAKNPDAVTVLATIIKQETLPDYLSGHVQPKARMSLLSLAVDADLADGLNTMADLKTYVEEHQSVGEAPANDGTPSGFDDVVQAIAYRNLNGHVPVKLSEYNREQREDDKGLARAMEMNIRVVNMQNLIDKLFHDHVQFVTNVPGAVQFAYEIAQDPKGISKITPKISPSDGRAYNFGTFTLAEKSEWDHMIFFYLFPHLKPPGVGPKFGTGALSPKDILRTIVKLTFDVVSIHSDAMQTEAAKGMALDRARAGNNTVLTRLKSGLAAGEDTISVARQYSLVPRDLKISYGVLAPDFLVFIDDLNTAHARPAKDDKAYRDGQLPIVPLLGPNDVWTLNELLSQQSALGKGI